MKPSVHSLEQKFVRRTLCAASVCLAFLGAQKLCAQAPDSFFTISPSGQPVMALEVNGPKAHDGSAVSIGVPSGAPNQKWLLVPKDNHLYVIRPASGANLALAAAKAGTDKGTPIVVETENGKPSQLWSIKQNANGSLSLLPKHAPDKGLDDLGGNKRPGAKLDLWFYNPDDEHLQWVMKPLAGAKLPDFAAPRPVVTANPVPADIPAGVIKEFTFSESAIFPGTKRTGMVFIPAQYDGSKPACVYVRQDGYNPKEKTMLEELIAAKDMPVTIGVFVKPGDLPSPKAGMPGRRNRCFEYDGVGDNLPRFLLEEILPYVAKTFDLKLSNSGNDRCIAGASSGGIAAFNAAWERPDAFSRVYANSGSFVAFRGGHEFPTLIRKFEAKPIRAYLTTATMDMENCAGDWYLLDQEIDKAMKFSGYDYMFTVLQGHHCSGWNDLFPEAMRFIWKGWPERVPAGTSAPRVRDIVDPENQWELVTQGCLDARGPACNSKGEVFFADPPANKIYRIGLDGKVGVFLADADHANSIAVGASDEIYTVSASNSKVMRYDAAGKGTVYASGIAGLYVLARPDGGLYVTADNKPGEPGKIWLIKDGKQTAIDADAKLPTGLAMRPDQWLLSVADGRSKWVYSYQIEPDGSLINRERFFWLHVPDWEDDAGAESVCYGLENKMLVATRFGIQVCADDGPSQVILPLPDRSRPMGVCLGGANKDTLFAFCGSKIWKRTVKIHAMGAFSPCTKAMHNPL